MINELFTIVLLLSGSIFMLLAAVGICRMPDLYTRMHAAAKVGTIGVILILGAVILSFRELAIATQCLLIILFFLLTAPIGSHMIGRAAYLTGVKLWKGTRVDEWGAAGTDTLEKQSPSSAEPPPDETAS